MQPHLKRNDRELFYKYLGKGRVNTFSSIYFILHVPHKIYL